MIHTVRFLKPIRASLATVTSSSLQLSHSKFPLNGTFRPIKTWTKNLRPEARDFLRNSQWKFDVRRYDHRFQNFCKSGGKVSFGSMLGLSIAIGSLGHRPCMAYCTDGFGFVEDDHQLSLSSGSDSEGDSHAVLTLLRKLLVPVFLFLTVLLNWGHPMIIGAKVTLILLSTKPSPLSVYLFVDQLRHQAMSKHPFFYKFKSLYAKKVDVADYTFLCLARVELSDQKFTLIGVLGSWWVLPVPSWEEAWSQLRNTVRYHFS